MYARFHMTDGRPEGGARCLSPGSMSIVHSPQVTRWAQKESLGLAWWLEELERTHIHSHGGGTNGQVSLLLMAPEREFAIAMVTNADHGGKLIEDVRRWALQHYLDIDQAESLPIESSEGDLAHYAGRYLRPFTEIELGLLGGRLVGQVTPKGGSPTEESPIPPPRPPMSLALCERDRLLVMDGPFKNSKLDIVRDSGGDIGWLRVFGRIHKREA